jgi:uncharacterized membrane protein YkgB
MSAFQQLRPSTVIDAPVVPPGTCSAGSTRSGVAARIDRITPTLHSHGLTALGGALGLVYIWFGALKIAGLSPAAALVVGTVPWPTPSWFVAALGWFEVALGVWILVGRLLRPALPVFAAHMAGTLGVLVFMPRAAFQHGNPFLLTMVGEFVVKNLVLLAAGVVVATRPTRRRT